MDNFELCKTAKLIPKEEIERVLKTSDSASAEIDCTWLCFEDVYEEVAKHTTDETTIIDFGCAYAPQAYWFVNCKKYIGIDSPLNNNVKFQTDNSELYLMSGQEFIRDVLPSLDLNMENVIAVCSYVPDKELQKMVACDFPYCYVVYCDDVIAKRLEKK